MLMKSQIKKRGKQKLKLRLVTSLRDCEEHLESSSATSTSTRNKIKLGKSPCMASTATSRGTSRGRNWIETNEFGALLRFRTVSTILFAPCDCFVLSTASGTYHFQGQLTLKKNSNFLLPIGDCFGPTLAISVEVNEAARKPQWKKWKSRLLRQCRRC